MGMVRWLGLAAGVILLLSIASSVIKTLMVPRATHSIFGSTAAWLVNGSFRKVTARVTDLRQRERVLAASAPAWLITLFSSWLRCLLLRYALLLWPLTHSS